MNLLPWEFSRLRDYVYNLCGIVISEEKSYLIRQRLGPLAVSLGCPSFGEFYKKASQNRLPKIEEQIINAITTNETSFFRDGHPFDTFRDYGLPRLARLVCQRKARARLRKGPKVSLWSAGSSSGQEPYSVAMLIHEYAMANRHLGISKEDFGLLATDISSQALSRAMAGEYSQMEMKRGLSADRMARYFVQEDARWVLDGSIRSMVEFRQMNLVKPFDTLGQFDVILCRNVLIYFDDIVRERMVNQFYDMLSEGGLLILGATENLYGITDKFESFHYGQTRIYKKASRDSTLCSMSPSPQSTCVASLGGYRLG